MDIIDFKRKGNMVRFYNGAIGVPVTIIEHLTPPPYTDRRRLRLDIVKFRKGNDDKDLRSGSKYYYMRYVVVIRP